MKSTPSIIGIERVGLSIDSTSVSPPPSSLSSSSSSSRRFNSRELFLIRKCNYEMSMRVSDEDLRLEESTVEGEERGQRFLHDFVGAFNILLLLVHKLSFGPSRPKHLTKPEKQQLLESIWAQQSSRLKKTEMIEQYMMIRNVESVDNYYPFLEVFSFQMER